MRNECNTRIALWYITSIQDGRIWEDICLKRDLTTSFATLCMK